MKKKCPSIHNLWHKCKKNAEEKLQKKLNNNQSKKSWKARPGFELGSFSILALDTASVLAGMLWLTKQKNKYLKCSKV